MGKRRATNIERIQHIMNFSNFGALKQMFIMEAIRNYAEAVSKANPEQCNTSFVNGESWIGVAKETLADLEKPIQIFDPEIDEED